MPDATTGQFQFQDFKAELVSIGFDGFSDIDLGTMVNRAYFSAARKARWYWEETTDTFTITPGSAYVSLWPAVSGELPYFRSLDYLYVTTTGQQGKLKPMKKSDFFENYLSQDLTSVTMRGEPDSYYVWQNRLYVLRPPAASRDFIAHYHRRAAPMVNPTDLPLTPPDMDEVIMLGARKRCHIRAQETGLAQADEIELGDILDDMLSDEDELMEEYPERTTPDNKWL